MKICGKCKHQKPLADFAKDKSRKDGLYPRCKDCHRSASRSWAKNNPEKVAKWKNENIERIKLNNDTWLSKNREKNKSRCRAWKLANPELCLAAAKAWRYKNSAKIKEQSRNWKISNRARATSTENSRRAAKLKRTPQWLTSEEKKNIDLVYLMAKALSDSTGIPYHVDHELPLQGRYVSGLHVLANLQIISAAENFTKRNIWVPT